MKDIAPTKTSLKAKLYYVSQGKSWEYIVAKSSQKAVDQADFTPTPQIKMGPKVWVHLDENGEASFSFRDVKPYS